jgi:hypothetical protein
MPRDGETVNSVLRSLQVSTETINDAQQRRLRTANPRMIFASEYSEGALAKGSNRECLFGAGGGQEN